MEFVPLLAIGALAKKIVDLIKAVRTGDWNGALTLLVVGLAGVAAVLIAAQTEWAGALQFGGVVLADLGFWSIVFLGVSVASFGALFGYDIPMSLDQSVKTERKVMFFEDAPATASEVAEAAEAAQTTAAEVAETTETTETSPGEVAPAQA